MEAIYASGPASYFGSILSLVTQCPAKRACSQLQCPSVPLHPPRPLGMTMYLQKEVVI